MIGAGDSIPVAVTTTLPLLPLMLLRSLSPVLTFLHQGQMTIDLFFKSHPEEAIFKLCKACLHFHPAVRESSSDPTGHLLVPELPLDSPHPASGQRNPTSLTSNSLKIL